MTNETASRADIRLAVIAGASVFISLGAFGAGLTGNLPSGISTVVVLLGLSIGLRIAWSYAAKSASSSNRARTMQMISNVGLAISGVSVVAALPRITHAAGLQTFLIDVLAQVWTLVLLTFVNGPVRTLGWRAFVGAALTGFLALTGLARFVGLPLVGSLGAANVLAGAVWVPLTEELFKLIPAAIVLAIAVRQSKGRPSALDVMLLGGWTGAGFALYENAAFGRGSFNLSADPIVSLFVPSAVKGMAFGWPVVQTGHAMHTALIALGVAFAVLYRRRVGYSWIAAAVAIAAALLEHCSQNAMVEQGLNEIVAKAALVLTLGGRLSTVLLIAGAVCVMVFEWRIAGGGFQPAAWLRLHTTERDRRSTLLARAQTEFAA